MENLSFSAASLPVVSDPLRMDVACFIGFVARRPMVPRQINETVEQYLHRLPIWLRSWLQEQDWNPGWHGRSVEDLVHLRNIPVLIDSWDSFDNLFAWDQRPLDNSGRTCHSSLGIAVRMFFASGGRRCYVVRVGDPWPFLISLPVDSDALIMRRSAREALRPSFPVPVASDRESWRGIGHLFGLPDVSFLCMPDLPEIFGMESWPMKYENQTVTEEIFVETGIVREQVIQRPLRSVSSPCCDEHGFRDWAYFVNQIASFIRSYTREVQFIASVPLPAEELAFTSEFSTLTDSQVSSREQIAKRRAAAAKAQWHEVDTIQTAFVQLIYPWIRNRNTARLPGDVSPPDGMFIGLLAKNALTRGTWGTLLGQHVSNVDFVVPILDRSTLEGVLKPRLKDRITVIGPTAGGLRILSDVTTDDDESYRPAAVSRLVSALVRAARIFGEQSIFDNNGEDLWSKLTDRFTGLLTGLWAEGALAGASAADAFEVRCDRSTMTQADIDAGRVLVRVFFTAAVPVTQVVVVLSMNSNGQFSMFEKQIEQEV
jgi:hypothetical protein